MIGQYLALRQPTTDPDLIGLISKKSSPRDIAQQVIADAAYMCSRTHGDAPDVSIVLSFLSIIPSILNNTFGNTVCMYVFICVFIY